jgi:aquaporin Z
LDRSGAPDGIYAAHHVRHPHLRLPHIVFRRDELEDRPLAGAPHPDRPWHWRLYLCEAVGTVLLMVVGIVTNTLFLAPGSPAAAILIAHPLLQTALCGLCFGGAGGLASMTRFGKVSGAHLSPSVTLAFTLSGKLAIPDMLGYFAGQIAGACVGTGLVFLMGAMLPSWNGWVRAVHYAATIPTPLLAPGWALLTELVVTLGLVIVLYRVAASPRLRWFAPWTAGLYFFLANPVFAWISGDSTNFARTLGPAMFSGDMSFLWLYLIAPLLGSALAVLLIRSDLFGKIHVAEARLVNFGHHGRVPRLDAPEAVGPPPEHL